MDTWNIEGQIGKIGNKCYIRGCTTRGGSHSTGRKLFAASTEKMFNAWRDSKIARRCVGKKFSQKSRICDLHFRKNDIERYETFRTTDGSMVTVLRRKPILKEDAVPSIFPLKIERFRRRPKYPRKKQQYKETSTTTLLKHMVNCFDSVPVKTETDLCEDTEVKENSCTDPLDEMSNRKQTMQADDCRRQGFRRGLEADKILGSADDNGELMYLIQWKGTDAVDMVSAKEANAKCPQIVIRFYEDRITWNKAKISA
ncbi:uncharacterized protein LOC105194151 isoform X1 [Solenopsis invicta]|uniref:uncharacterized protein LOC105194151 isoform X1 n=1 Tax=Solenopsis invicta TaxID=13686 RepID=UPI000595C847|nr:uncharacterized protein LOC105194151 isoform X1 [Solenopsis invicta]